MIKFGFNIDSGAIEDRSYLINTLKAGKFKAHLMMVNPPVSNEDPKREIEAVVQLRDEVGDPNVTWIYRRYSVKEGNWRQFNVEDEARRWEREGYREIIRQDPSNEPGDTDNPEYVKSRVRLLQLAHNLGIKLCVGTWGVGGPHHEAIKSGIYDELIAALAQYGGMLDVHEYMPILPEIGAIFGYEALLDPTKYRTLEFNDPWEVRENHWLMRRLDYWLLRADAINQPRPIVNISECLWDKIPDAETKLNNQGGLWDRFQQQYGSDKALFNGDLRGVLSLENVFKAAYPELTYTQALFKTWRRWYETLYAKRPEVFSAQAFQWGKLWRFPATHDWSYKAIQPFVVAIVQYSRIAETPQPTPDPIPPVLDPDPDEVVMKTVKIQGITKGVRIRSLPSTSSVIVNSTLLDQPVTVKLSERAYWEGSGLRWYLIEILGMRGFVASSVITVVEDSFVLTESERQLILAWRERNWNRVTELLNVPDVRRLTNVEVELLEALDEGDIVLAIRKALEVYEGSS